MSRRACVLVALISDARLYVICIRMFLLKRACQYGDYPELAREANTGTRILSTTAPPNKSKALSTCKRNSLMETETPRMQFNRINTHVYM